MKRFILVAMVAVMCIVIMTGCQKIEREEEWSVTARVTDKDYSSSYKTLVPIQSGKFMSMRLVSRPAQYIVTISYKGISRMIDDKELYESSEIGDTFQMILYQAYNKHRDLVKQELRFPE